MEAAISCSCALTVLVPRWLFVCTATVSFPCCHLGCWTSTLHIQGSTGKMTLMENQTFGATCKKTEPCNDCNLKRIKISHGSWTTCRICTLCGGEEAGTTEHSSPLGKKASYGLSIIVAQKGGAKARFRRRSFHELNILELRLTLVRHWSGVDSDDKLSAILNGSAA